MNRRWGYIVSNRHSREVPSDDVLTKQWMGLGLLEFVNVAFELMLTFDHNDRDFRWIWRECPPGGTAVVRLHTRETFGDGLAIFMCLTALTFTKSDPSVTLLESGYKHMRHFRNIWSLSCLWPPPNLIMSLIFDLSVALLESGEDWCGRRRGTNTPYLTKNIKSIHFRTRNLRGNQKIGHTFWPGAGCSRS